MCFNTYLCVVLVAVSALGQSQMEQELLDRESDVTDYSAQIRTRRIAKIFGTAFVKGFKATSKILKGSKEIPSNNMLERVYKKTGSYNQAKRDFFSVRPTNIYNTPDGAMMGKIGDRYILLQSDYPEIRITKAKKLIEHKPDDFVETVIKYGNVLNRLNN